MSQPTVSIAVLTYNHQSFLTQALDSFLMQKTDFEVEIVIGDDASTDSTAQILKNYKAKFPDQFRVTLHKENIGMLPNFISTLEACNGKYLAFCEGDDYWTDPLKLQKQVNFLEANPDYAICCHNVMIYDQPTKTLQEDEITNQTKHDFNRLDLVKGNFMHTPSVMLKNDFKLTNWFNQLPIGDWPLYLTQIKDRKIKKLDDKMAVYRVHKQSAWSSKNTLFKLQRTINTIQLIKSNIVFSTEELAILNQQQQQLEFDYKKLRGSFFKRFKRFLRREK